MMAELADRTNLYQTATISSLDNHTYSFFLFLITGIVCFILGDRS
jgi:hypothetical protein